MKVLTLCGVAPVHPHHASSELSSKEANDAINEKAVTQHECHSSSNDVPPGSKTKPTLPVELSNNDNQF